MDQMRIKAEKWVNNGLCIGYHNNETYFISGAIPGEEVICQLVKSTSRLKLLQVITTVHPSDLRIQPDCDAFLSCGGCQFRHINYSEELRLKEKLLRQELNFAGEIKIKSGNSVGYRNNVQLKSENGSYGFFKSGSNELVEFPQNGCQNLSPALNSYILTNIKKFHGKEIKLRQGDTQITEYSEKESTIRVGENVFKIPPNGFFQINRLLIPDWINEIKSLLPETKVDFLELFSGCGLISVSIADRILSATCMEMDNQSVAYSKMNAKNNKKSNLSFVRKDLYSSQDSNLKSFSVKYWIANPPRNGLGSKLISSFQKIMPELLIYSSCNYVTLGHDLKKISSFGYKITGLSLFDFFPRTHYFETLVKLEKV